MLSAAKGANDVEVLRRLLNHVNQRFRFSYVLGNVPIAAVRDSDFEDEEEELEGEVRSSCSPRSTMRLISRTLKISSPT